MNRHIEDIIREEGVYVSTTVGTSMYPMLRNRKDTIIITPHTGRLKPYDIPLYRRGDQYVLHRILEVRPDSYVIRGDNCIEKEYGITDEQIIGVLSGFYRGNKKINMDGVLYRLYSRLWPAANPLVRAAALAKRAAKKGLRIAGWHTKPSQDEEKKDIKAECLYLAELLRAALRGDIAKTKPDAVDWEIVYQLAKRSSLEGISAYGAETLEEKPPAQIWDKWKNTPMQVTYRVLNFDVEREQILAQMKKEGLSYLPLKGALIAGYYPKPGMRTMADNDILYSFVESDPKGGFRCKGNSEKEQNLQTKKASQLMKKLMEERGYRLDSFFGVHEEYLKEPIFNFEMHQKLLHPTSPFYEYFKNPWQRAQQDPTDSNLYHFSDEDEYLFFLIHAYKHFDGGGCGVRLLTDIYVFNEKKEKTMDQVYISEELDKLGIREFAEKIKTLSEALFSKQSRPLSEEETSLLMFLMHCGTYGTVEVSVQNKMKHIMEEKQVSKTSARLRYIWNRIIPEKRWWKENHPIAYRVPILKPLLFVWRTLKNPKKAVAELRAALKKEG